MARPHMPRNHQRLALTASCANQIDAIWDASWKWGIATPLEGAGAAHYSVQSAASMSWKPCRVARPCAPGEPMGGRLYPEGK